MKKVLMMGSLLLFTMFGSTALAQWVQTNGPIGGAVYHFASREALVYAAVGNEVFVSSDTGKSWQSISDGLQSTWWVKDIVRRGTDLLAATLRGVFRLPLNSSTWLNSSAGLPELSGGNAFAMDEVNVYLASDKGVFVSTDDGESWMAANNGLTGSIGTIALNGHILFAATNHGSGATFLSTDKGISWTQKTNGPMDTFVYDFEFSGSGVYAGTWGGLFFSGNNGDYWSPMKSGLPDAGVAALTLCGPNLFVGIYNRGQVYKTTDGGASWQVSWNGSRFMSDILLSLQNLGGLLFVGLEGAGVLVSADSGANWRYCNSGLFKTKVTSFLPVDGRIFAGADRTGLFVSSNQGASWTPADAGLSQNWKYTLAKSGTKIWAGAGGLFVSSDKGGNWSPVTNGLPRWASVDAMAVDSPNAYIGVLGTGIFRSTDDGSSWTSAGSGLTSNQPRGFALLPPYVFVATDGGVFRSTDVGASWTKSSVGLTDTFAVSLVAQGQRIFAGTAHGGVFASTDYGSSWHSASNGITDPYTITFTASDAGLFVSTCEDGVFFSSDMGTNWVPVNTGLPKRFVWGLCVDGGYLYAGTDQDGVWRRPLSEITTSVKTGSDFVPAMFTLDQNYPNPFNPTTVVSYQLSVVSSVKLVVYDVLGREVVVLVNEKKQPGRYEVKLDATGFASGIYFYRLQADNLVQTRKMVLMK